MSELQEALGIGSATTESTPKPAQARHAIPTDDDDNAAADETPVQTDAVAEDSEPTAGEEAAAEADRTGADDPQESDSNSPTDTEEGSEQEPDDDSTDEHGKPWPKSYLRRLAREKDKRERIEDRLESELSTLKAEMEELRAKPAAENQTSHQPVTDVEQTLTQKVKAAESIIDFVEDNPDGATTPDGRSWTREQLRAEKRKAERDLREAEANLASSRQERQELDAAIKAELPRRHPWITDRQHNATVALNGLLKKFPVLNTHPLFRAMAADSIGMEMLRQQAAKKSTNGVPPVNGNGASHARVAAPPPPRPVARPAGRPGTVPAPVNGKRAAFASAEQSFLETGDHESGKALISSLIT